MTKWFITLPPEGAARYSGIEVVNAFKEKLGEKSVKVFDFLSYQKAFNSWLKNPEPDRVADLSNQSMFVQCLDFAPTHMLVLPLCPVTLYMLNLLKRQNIKTVHWFYEDFRAVGYWRSVVRGYDYFFAIQKGPIPEACRVEGTVYRYLPQAAPQLDEAPSAPVRPDVDLVFVGIPSPYRIGLLEYLAEQGITLLIAGLNWHTYTGPLEKYLYGEGWVDTAKTPELYSRGNAALNISYSDPVPDRENTHLSPRIFDILKTGQILITESAPLADSTLEGLTYLSFETPEDLVKLVRFPDGRPSPESLRQNRQSVKESHTYFNRVQSLLDWTA
jgi:hypothetical protein